MAGAEFNRAVGSRSSRAVVAEVARNVSTTRSMAHRPWPWCRRRKWMPETAAREQSDEEDDASAPFHAPALIRRAQRSSESVQPFCFTLSHRRVGPASYRLASSL